MLICSEKKSNLLVFKRNHDALFYVYTLSMKKEKDFGVSNGNTSFNSLMVWKKNCKSSDQEWNPYE